MAESGNAGGWWGGWIQTAKEKSASALEFVKKDLAEFSTTMQTDTVKVTEQVKSKLNQESATAAGQKMKDGVSSILGGITQVLNLEAEDQQQEKKTGAPTSASSHIFDKARARLHAIQVDPGTYCNEPPGPPEKFDIWKTGFDLDEKKGDISELLVVNVEVRSLYTQLVPTSVSHAEFWQRYYYKCHQLAEDEARKNALKRRAEVCKQEAELEWDDDEWGDVAGPASPPSSPSGMEMAAAALKITQTEDSTTSSDTTNIHSQDDQTLAVETVAAVTDIVINEQQREDDDEEDTVDSDPQIAGPSAEVRASEQQVASPTETLSTTDTSVETLTVVSAESSLATSPLEELQIPPNDVEVRTREKGDLVVVGSGSERTTPSSDSAGSHTKESTDDDWEKDFDIEVTEEDLKLAKEAAQNLTLNSGGNDDDDDWESWE